MEVKPIGSLKTVADVKAAVGELRNGSADDEVAHSYEDGIWLSLLQAIANGEAQDPKAMAAEAIKTQDIDFSRWYA